MQKHYLQKFEFLSFWYPDKNAATKFLKFVHLMRHFLLLAFSTKKKKSKTIYSSCWSSSNSSVSRTGGLRFKSRADQSRHSVVNSSPPLRSCVARAQWRGDGPRQLVTRFGVLHVQRVAYNERFDFDLTIYCKKVIPFIILKK